MRFCTYCGQPLDPVTQECPVCGGYKTQDITDRFTEPLKRNFRSVFMLLLCVFTSASVLLSMFSNDFFWMNLLSILMPVALWITYFSACTSKPGMGLGGIRLVSAIITICRVLIWIILAILLVISIIIISVPSFISGDTLAYISYFFPEYEMILDMLFEQGGSIILAIGIIMLAAVVILALVNIFFVGCIRKSIKSVIDSFNNGENHLEKLKCVMIWLIIIGVLSCFYLFYALTWSSTLFVITIFAGALLAGKISKTTPED